MAEDTKKLSVKEEAREAIVAGGSYLLKVDGASKLFTADNIHEFPSDADLAIGNPALEAAALGDIDAEIERLQAAKKKLEASKKEEAAAAKAEAPAEAPAEEKKAEAPKKAEAEKK